MAQTAQTSQAEQTAQTAQAAQTARTAQAARVPRRARKTNSSRVNRPLLIACILFCLTLITLRMTSDLYAKYSSTSSSGDSARVAAMGTLSLTEAGAPLTLIPGVNLTQDIEVGFTSSEVATYIFVEITPTATAPVAWETTDHTTFSIKSGGKTLVQWSVAAGWTYLDDDSGTYVYYRALNPNTALSNADVIAGNGTITVSNTITKAELATLTDVSILVHAAVVQAGGFDSPEAAWDSVSAKEGGT